MHCNELAFGRLLCLREGGTIVELSGKRPRDGRAAGKHDELASPQSVELHLLPRARVAA